MRNSCLRQIGIVEHKKLIITLIKGGEDGDQRWNTEQTLLFKLSLQTKTTLISFNLQDTKINSYIRTFSDSLSLSYLPPTTKGMTESAKFAVDYPIIWQAGIHPWQEYAFVYYSWP